MDNNFLQKINEWNFVIRNEYKNLFKKEKLLPPENRIKNSYFLEKKKFGDKRILLGGLKFFPFLIFCFLKNFPMPWNSEQKKKVLVHDSENFFVFLEKNWVIDCFFSPQWSIYWLHSKKNDKKIKKIHRVTFPILDDEESFDFYKKKVGLFFLEKNFQKEEFNDRYLTKYWFNIKKDMNNWFLKNSFKKTIFIDFPLRSSLFRLKFKGGLFKGSEDEFFFSKFQNFSRFFFFLWLNKKQPCFSLSLILPKCIKLGLTGEKEEKFSFLKDQVLKKYFKFLGFPEKGFTFKKFWLEKNSKKNIAFFGLEKNFLWEEEGVVDKKNQFFNICPFFIDIFYDQKKVSVSLGISNKEKNFFKNQEKILPAFVIPIFSQFLTEAWDLSRPKTVLSYFFLLRKFFLKKKKNHHGKVFFKKNKVLKIFKRSNFFFQTEINWIEGGINICKTCHSLFLLLLGRKNLSFLNLDFNFNLKPTKTLTTKERKKSRFSNSFHLCREIIRFTKMLIDCHFQMKMKVLDIFQLADGVHFILTHLGHLTGLYRYKYKIMKQIRICKSIRNLLYQKFNKPEIKGEQSFVFWAPVWKVWVFFLRGMSPILERWLSNLLARHFNGRKFSKKTVTLTKQRVEAYFDIEIKTIFLNEVKNHYSSNFSTKSWKDLLIYANDAWKCWKANKNWVPPEMHEKIIAFILQYVKTKSDWWIKTAFLTREKIRRGLTMDKTLMRKNLGRLTRLWFKTEQKRQIEYLESKNHNLSNETVQLLDIFSKWVEVTRFGSISFPSFSEKIEIKLLILALENVYQNTILSNKKYQNKIGNLKIIENSFKEPERTLTMIKETLITQKIFHEIGISFLDNFSYLLPVYNIDFQENLTDSFLDHYIWFKANTQSFFPNWVKPSDFEISPFLVFKNFPDILKIFSNEIYLKTQKFSGFKIKITNSLEEITFYFLQRFLRKMMDPNLAEILCLKNNVGIFYKDMSFLNILGLIKGLSFSGFLIQTYFFLIDIVFLGLENSLILSCSKYQNTLAAKKIDPFWDIKFYLRYLSNIIIIARIERKVTFKKKKEFYWKRLNEKVILDSNEGFRPKFEKKIPIFLGKLRVISKFLDSPCLEIEAQSSNFEMCGFNIILKFPFWSDKKVQLNFKDRFFNLNNRNFISKISDSTIQKFENRIRQIILTSGSTTFTKVINKWNSNILGSVSFFREACLESLKFLISGKKNERKLQNRVKISLNSKMPSRFPPVLFYSPKELGGLGMLSISSPIVPDFDIKFSKKFPFLGVKMPFLEEEKLKVIPSLINFISSWKTEFVDSRKVWTEYLKRRIKKKEKKKTISIEDLEDLWNKGIPRINTLFQRDRNILAFDHGWRIRMELKKYQQLKNNPFWWTSSKHDGKLWDLSRYRIQVISQNGGVENILEHTLFKGTFFPSWEGLFWEKNSGFEESFNSKKLTNAQRSGLNQIPNRRFTLWWSPTINRGNVFIGFKVQLDLTGIFMHGKIPTLKISLIQIFRAHLWQKIHESICISFCKVLDTNSKSLYIQLVQKEQIHPRKSYKMNSSCADIVLFSKNKWEINPPSLMTAPEEKGCKISTEKGSIFWLDIQLRWGDFDSHDIERYSRGKFLDYSTDLASVYPSKKGILIAFDLAYNIFGGYGYWIPSLKKIFRETCQKIMKVNPALYILRERIRKSLHLYVSETPETLMGFEDFKNIFKGKKVWLVDESCFYRVSIHRTSDGNLTAKPVNGCLIIFLPIKGTLVLRVIHASFWKQQKRLSQLSRWKVAEEISSIISKLPKEEHPVEILTFRKLLIDPLGIYLSDLSSTLIKYTEIKIFFQSLIEIPKIKELIKKSENSRSFIVNLYDNWLSFISPFTAFSRLILILKSIQINFEKVKKRLNLFSSSQLRVTSFWPNLSDQEWVEMENFLKDLILEDFISKKNCSLKDLTQTEIRDIILGTKVNIIGTKMVSETSVLNENLEISVISDELKRTSFVSTPSKNFCKKFVTKSIKNSRSFINKNLEIFFNIKTQFIPKKKNSFFFIVPRNLLKQIITISRKDRDLIALTFGNKNPKNLFFRELKIFLVPPQLNLNGNIDFAKKIPENGILKNFLFSGSIKVIRTSRIFPEKFDLEFSRELLENNWTPEIEEISLLSLKKKKKNWDFSGFFLEISKNFRFFEQISKISLVVSDRLIGFFLIPKNKKWDFFFNSFFFSKKKKYLVNISFPTLH